MLGCLGDKVLFHNSVHTLLHYSILPNVTYVIPSISSFIYVGGGAIGPLLAVAALTTAFGYTAYNAIYNVDAGHRAIIYNRLTGVKNDLKAEGTHVMIPWFEV